LSARECVFGTEILPGCLGQRPSPLVASRYAARVFLPHRQWHMGTR
jgi:hypothetical protein